VEADAVPQAFRLRVPGGACLRFAEQFVVDAKAIGDEEAAPVVAALGEAGTVAFVEALAIFDGFSRFCCMLDVAPREAAA